MSGNKQPRGPTWLRILGSHKRSKSGTPDTTTPQTGPSNTSSSNVPLPSPSASTAQPGASTQGNASSSLTAMLSALRGSMKILQAGCGAFSPLHSAAGAMIDVLDNIETMAQGSRDLRELASELPQWAIVLSGYVSNTQPDRMSARVRNLAGVLREQADYIRAQQKKGRMKRLEEAEQEVEGLKKCYRRIETSFFQLQMDASLSTWKNTDDHLKESRLNGISPAHDARYDSSFSDNIERGGCFENTRVTVLSDIRDWIYNPNETKIYWMNGMAGTGKTTIAYSICTELERNGRLGASFFCSRASPKCRDVRRILPTIAYQLAQVSYPFRSALSRIIGEVPDIGQRNISLQFGHLIKDTLLEVKDLLPNGLVVVIDALDECSEPRSTEIMLEKLFCYAADLPVRFFLTSRPEPLIVKTILPLDKSFRSILHLHNVEEQFVKADIETYLTVALAKLSLADDQIKQLAEQSGILFIYAATVARYILAKGPGANPSARLAAVLSGASAQGTKKDKMIDQLYVTILDGVFSNEFMEESEREIIKLVLWTVVCAREPLAKATLGLLSKVDEEQVPAALEPLQSVLHVSESSDVVSTLHASFPDFMLNPERSRPLGCDELAHSRLLASRCFDLMKEGLRFNICGLETSYRLDKDVPGLEDRANAAISPELFYACRYWGAHIRQSATCNELLHRLNEFLRKRLLFWMEVLNLKGWIGYGSKVLVEAQEWLANDNEISEIQKFLYDAHNFVTMFAANPVHGSTPHIYLSVLPLVSKQSKIWENYWGRTRGLIRVGGTLNTWCGGAVLATWGVGFPVTAVAYSSDGTRIVSGSADYTVRVWDARTGNPLFEPLEGHTNRVNSVAFSPNGTRIASGSSDCTIRLWDALSGKMLLPPLQGHTEQVNSVSFSPGGARIVSGSNDSAIIVWDVRTGSILVNFFEDVTGKAKCVSFSPDGDRIVSSHTVTVQISAGSSEELEARPLIRVWDSHNGSLLVSGFEGHNRPVHSVVFSPDSTCIASGSDDCTIRLWDARYGTPLASTLTGHTGYVNSISFSSDGARIVSGSFDNTIRVWDVHKRVMIGQPFEGHTAYVYSVSFSPDGTRIVTASRDCTIRVWTVHNDRETPLDSSFQGPSDEISSVAFSPDGTLIASASNDQTITLWDSHNGDPLVTSPKVHTTQINSIIFSPDGTRLISASDDCTRMWGIMMTPSVQIIANNTFRGHAATSVAFSPDGARIVSGSRDCTIKVRNAHDGALAADPFKGHDRAVTSVAFSPNGTRIASGSRDCTVQVRHADSGALLASPFKGHKMWVTSVAFSPDGAYIVSGSLDLTIRVWGSHNGTLIAGPFKGHTALISSVTFSPDGARIISSSWDGSIRVWKGLNGAPYGDPFQGHTHWVTSAALSRDGGRIVSGSKDRTIRIWELFDDDYSQSPILSAWNINLDGWVLDSSSRTLLWLPMDLRVNLWEFLPCAPNSLVIKPKGTIAISWANLSLGELWHQCYLSSP